MMDSVIILNEELYSMSLAFEKAGYKILTAYESDKKACEIYKKYNKTDVVYKDITEIDIYTLPDSDVLAGKLKIYDYHNRERNAENNILRKGDLLYTFLEVVNQKRPKAILCEINANAVKSDLFHYFMAELSRCYKVAYKVYKVNEVINVPVNEHKMYVVGIREDILGDYNFISEYMHQEYSNVEILEYTNVDEWYFKVNHNQIKNSHKNDEVKNGQFYCWKDNGYIACEDINWNTVKIPLVNINGEIRKVTHREIARLKGYPEEFHLDIRNKAWLYSKLMCASNINLLYLLIRSLQDVIKERSLLNQQATRAIRFEELFRQFLEENYEVRVHSESRDNL